MPNLEKISLVSLKKQVASARMLMYCKKIQFVAYFVFTYNSCVGKPLVSGILQLILIILNRKAEAEFMKKLFGGIFHKKDETQASAAPDNEVAAPRIAQKRNKKDTLASVLSESYPPSAVSVLKGIPKSCVTVDGIDYYIAFEVNTDDPIIGGINIKRKKKEAIGSLVEQIANSHIQVYAPADLLDQDKMLIIPDDETIRNMSGYGILTDPGLNYTITLVKNDGSISVMDGATMNYDEIKGYINDSETSPKDLLADKHILEALENQASDDNSAANNTNEPVESDSSADYDGINLSDAEIVDDDDEEEELPGRPDVNNKVGLHDAQELPHNTMPVKSEPVQGTNVIAGGNADLQPTQATQTTQMPVQPVQNTQASIQQIQPSQDLPVQQTDLVNNQPANIPNGPVGQPVNTQAVNDDFGVQDTPINDQPVGNLANDQIANGNLMGQNQPMENQYEDDFMANGDDEQQGALQNFDVSDTPVNQDNGQVINDTPVDNQPVVNQTDSANNDFAPSEDADSEQQPEMPQFDENAVTGDDLDQNMNRMFFSTNFNIDVNSDPIDLELSKDQGIVEFDTDRDTDSSWLNQYLNQMGREANQDIKSAHVRHLQAVRHLYLNLISKELNDIQDHVSDTTPDTEFGRQKAEIINSADDRRDNLDDEVKAKSDKLDEDFNRKADAVAKRAADEARQAYVDENQADLERQKDRIRGQLEEQISRDQVEQTEKLEKRENDEALKLYNQAVDATVQKAMHKYHQFMQQEEKQRVSWRKKIEAFTRHHRKEEIMRAKALADEVEQQKQVKETRQKMQAKIDELQAELEHKNRDYQDKLKQADIENKHLNETNAASYEAQIKSIETDRDNEIKRYEAEINSIKANSEREKQELNSKISELQNKAAAVKQDTENEISTKYVDQINSLKQKITDLTNDANHKIQTRDQIIGQLKLDAKEQANHAQSYYAKQSQDQIKLLKQQHLNDVARLQGKIRAYKLKLKTMRTQFDSQSQLVRILKQNNQDVQDSALRNLAGQSNNGSNNNDNNSLLAQLLAYKQIQDLDNNHPAPQPSQPTQPTQATQATQASAKQKNTNKNNSKNNTIGWLIGAITVLLLSFAGLEHLQTSQARLQEQMRQEMHAQINDAQKRQQARDQEATKKDKKAKKANKVKKQKEAKKQKNNNQDDDSASSQSSQNTTSANDSSASSQSSQSSTSANDSSGSDTVYTGY